jgi:ABC-type multidrug transport system fused ATPase/permease subunit
VLILDEPTAPLDRDTERALTEGLDRVMRGRTTILITHRPELAARASRIIRLDGARLADPVVA